MYPVAANAAVSEAMRSLNLPSCQQHTIVANCAAIIESAFAYQFKTFFLGVPGNLAV